MRRALPLGAALALLIVAHGAFVASCTDRIATSPWCMPWLAIGLDAVVGVFVVYAVILAVRRRTRRSN